MPSSQDLFNFNANFNSSPIVTAQEMILTFAGTGKPLDYLIQNVAVNYQRPIQLIKQISDGSIFYLDLPPQGVLAVGRIVGNTPITSVIGPPGRGIWTAPNASEGSNAGKNRTATLSPISGNGPRYEMFGCICNNYNVSMDANGSLVSENVSISFGKLSVS